MAKRKGRWAVQPSAGSGPDKLEPSTAAFAAQLRGEDAFEWPAEPTEGARVWGVTDDPYVVDVEFVRDFDGELVPVGVAVRRTFLTSRRKKGMGYPFAEGTEPKPVAAAEVRRIPIGRAIRAALTAVAQPDLTDERHDELERILVPRGRPKRGRSVKWYCDLLDAARRFEKRGLSPAKEIARGKTGVSENLVHQWLHVARRYEREGLCGG